MARFCFPFLLLGLKSTLRNIVAAVFIGLCFHKNATANVNDDLSSLEVYWHSKLPNTSMPKVIQNLIHPGGDRIFFSRKYPYWCSKNVSADVVLSFYFHLKDIYPGGKIEGITFGRSIIGNRFVPRVGANIIPYTSTKFAKIPNQVPLDPSSQSRECGTLSCEGVKTFCATSLESLIDNVISELGTQDIQVMTTVLIGDREPQNEEKLYKVASRIKKLPRKKIVLCHPQPLQQAVFYCHISAAFERYIVPLEGIDGIKVNALAVCHYDTENFNPIFFEVLKVKPGTKPMCHFFPGDHLIWASHL